MSAVRHDRPAQRTLPASFLTKPCAHSDLLVGSKGRAGGPGLARIEASAARGLSPHPAASRLATVVAAMTGL